MGTSAPAHAPGPPHADQISTPGAKMSTHGPVLLHRYMVSGPAGRLPAAPSLAAPAASPAGWNLEGRLLAATVMTLGRLAGATPHASDALLPARGAAAAHECAPLVRAPSLPAPLATLEPRPALTTRLGGPVLLHSGPQRN